MEQGLQTEKRSRVLEQMRSRVPDRVINGVNKAFCKGFDLVFEKSAVFLEKVSKVEDLRENHIILDYAVQRKGGKRELDRLCKTAKKADLKNLLLTTTGGIGLGILGIGLPDVLLFLAILIKGICETGVYYGFDYKTPGEKLRILRMIETAFSSGEEFIQNNKAVDELFSCQEPTDANAALAEQKMKTAEAMAMDMLVLKVIQGIPVVGVFGGAADSLCYAKILKYVGLKYRKHYLLRQKERLCS